MATKKVPAGTMAAAGQVEQEARVVEVSDQTAAAPEPTSKKAPREVVMKDRRTVTFKSGSNTSQDIQVIDGQLHVSIDISNGDTHKFTLPESLILKCAEFGLSRKCANFYTGQTDPDEISMSVAAGVADLSAGNWNKERAAGDGFSGSNEVIRGIMNVMAAKGKPKTVEQVKEFLDKQINPSTSRQALYAALRNNPMFGDEIRRLEEEKRAKSPAKPAPVLDGLLNDLFE